MKEQEVFLGVDIGGTNVKIGAINAQGEILEQRKIATQALRPANEVLANIAQTASEVRNVLEARSHTVCSLGIGIPGATDYIRGVCLNLTNFPGGWQGVEVKKQLADRLQLPTFMVNDVRAITLAEHLFGAGKDIATMIMVAIGTGIGGGVVIDNTLLFGRDGNAGELGHINVVPDGILCGCGSRGCLECYASGPAIAGAALRALTQQNATLIRELVQNDYNKVSAEVVAQAAEQGDQVAKDILITAGEHIGRAMSKVAVVVEPDMVVVGGGVAQAGTIFFNSICESFRNTLHIIPPDTIAMRLSTLGYYAGVQGTAAWGMQNYLATQTA